MSEKIETFAVIVAKIIGLSIAVAFARKFHEKEEVNFKEMIVKIFMSAMVLTIVFVLMSEFTTFSETGALMIAGVAGFSTREILDLWIKKAKNPSKGRKLLTGQDVDFDSKNSKDAKNNQNKTDNLER